MPIAIAIINALMAARNMKQSDDKLSSGLGLLGSAYSIYNAANSMPSYNSNNTLGDFGVRRNYL